MSNGKIIVIDGLDGCGKSTQLEITEKKLTGMGHKVKTISFPDYDSPSSALVKMYLAGEFSDDPDDVNAYAASSFYAVDRYASYMMKWKKNYEDGDIILAARYVSSNALHQMSKLPEEQWADYLEWLHEYEHDKLGLPRADRVIFMDMPIETAHKLITKRYDGNVGKMDIHESRTDYLTKCREAALYASRKMGWKVVECSKDGEPLPISDVSDMLMDIIKKII